MLRKRKLARLLLLLALIPIGLAIAGGVYFFVTYQSIDLARQLEEPSLLLDRDGDEIGLLATEIRQVVSLDEMSPHLTNAIIAIEDSRFRNHFGIDLRGLARAFWRNIKNRRVVEGGSTITQQLAENEYFLHVSGPARTLDKKLREAVYAIKLERHFTKDEILERYLNRIYFGHGRFGVEAASQYFFNKSARDLDLAEAAMLAGAPRGPNLYSLVNNPELAHQRRDIVLARMEELGYINAEQRQQAQERELVAVEHEERVARARHFRQEVVDEALEILGQHRRYRDLSHQELNNLIYNQGLQIHTTLSLPAQAAAEQVIQQRGEAYQEEADIQASLIALDPSTGGIMAMVGSVELTGTYNRVYQGVYDMGSAYKGPLYAAALENGYTAASTVLCSETDFPNPNGNPDPYRPSDYGGRYHNQELRIRRALEESCNVVAVKVADDIGRDKFLDMVARLNPALGKNNIGSAADLQLPLGPESTPMDLTLTYAPFANGGYAVAPYTIQEIRDRDGIQIYQAQPPRQPVLDEQLAYITTNMLQGVQGISNMPVVAGKTGTASNDKGVVTGTVFVGYTKDILATIFFGFDLPGQALPGALSNAVEDAVPAWKDFMNRYYDGQTPQDFSPPDNIHEAVVCADSGQLATHFCPETYVELFLPGTEPQQRCEQHGGDLIEICTSTGLPANPHCPQHLRAWVRRQPWMQNLQCWLHGSGGETPPDSGDQNQEEGDEDLEDEDDENEPDAQDQNEFEEEPETDD